MLSWLKWTGRDHWSLFNIESRENPLFSPGNLEVSGGPEPGEGVVSVKYALNIKPTLGCEAEDSSRRRKIGSLFKDGTPNAGRCQEDT